MTPQQEIMEAWMARYSEAVQTMDEAVKEIERLRADRDRWRSIAERAMENLETAVQLLEQLRGAIHD